MVLASDIADFYISPHAQESAGRLDWLVCNRSALRVAGVHRDFGDAMVHALRMAAHQASTGQPAQIHVREADMAWHTIWCSDATPPRFPSWQ